MSNEPHKTLKFNITVDEINAYRPCYPAETKLGEGWSGNLIDILKAENINPEDRLWAVTLFAGDKINRLFAVHCARQALMLIKNPDSRSLDACDVAEKFALGLATERKMAAARAAAWDSSWDSSWDAAWTAALDAALDAALAAALAASRDAALAASRDAAWAAALDADRAAAWAASRAAARAAALDADRAAAWAAQIDFLIQMIGDEI